MQNQQPDTIITSTTDPALAELFPVGRLYADAALSFGGRVRINVEVPYMLFIQREKESPWQMLYHAQVPLNNAASAKLANNKAACNTFLQVNQLPATIGVLITAKDFQQKKTLPQLPPFPVVVKPNANTAKGKDVITNITNQKDLQAIIKKLLIQYPEVIIEEFVVRKKEFRVLVLDGVIIGIVQRIPAYVIGDGKQTIQKLITEKNILRKEMNAGLISLDQELRHNLRTRNISLSSVPKKGIHVQLKNVCNFGAGGETLDVPNTTIDPALKKLIKNVAKLTGIRLLALDVMADSLSTKNGIQNLKIIEVNTSPDIAMHGFQNQKIAEGIAKKIVRTLFSQ